MKVKELIKLLKTANPDAEVLIADNGSILPTDVAEETSNYNAECDTDTDEYYIVTGEFE